MTRFLSLLLFVVFLSSPVWAAEAEKPFQQRSISVTGEAEIKVVPDQVQISLTAEDRGVNLIETKAKNDAAVKALVEYATKDLGIEARHVQTDFVSVEPQYRSCNYDDEQTGKCSPLDITYYTVRKGIQICLKDLTKYEGLITKALALGVKRIDNIQFVTTELRKHRDKARDMAAQASLEKAQAVAGKLGMKVGKPLNISLQNYNSYYYWPSSYGARGGNNQYMAQNAMQQAAPSGAPQGEDGGSELAIGQISVTAQVSVNYELE
jgi:uncharacterized protein YggE